MKIVSALLIGIFMGASLWSVQPQPKPPHHIVKVAKHHRVWHLYKVGEASWYGCGGDTNICPWGDDNTQGKPTSSGVIFDTHKAICASWYYPLHSWVIVKNPKTHKATACHILDRGPNLWTHRVLDVSQAVKKAIGMVGNQQVAIYSKVKPQLVADAF